MSDGLAEETAEALRARLPGPPDVLITLGSGLGAVAEALDDVVEVDVTELPHLPTSTVIGHVSRLSFGTHGGVRVLAQVGRIHLYEGHDGATVARTVEVAALLGARTYLTTNASGGIDPSMTPGDLVAISDHLNLTGASPHTGVLRDGRPVFVDLAAAYDVRLRALAHESAHDLAIPLRDGVYAGVRGPAYETPAEVAALRAVGADLVGMSTVLEVIAARARGLDVLGLSIVTNVHGHVPADHDDVVAVAERSAPSLAALVLGVLERLGS